MKKLVTNFGLKPALFLAVLGLGFTSCSDDNDDDVIVGEDNARLTVRMTDAPGDYEEVNIDVQDVMIKTEADSEEGEDGWESLDGVEAGIYNLLDLTGGITQLLADSEVPAGTLNEIRLVLGDDNSVLLRDEVEPEPLSTPSAQQSGLKLNVGQELEAGEEYEYLLDFDVEESIVTTGNGGYILKPVIRLSAYANTGVIVGEVHPTDHVALVKATSGSTTISAYTDEEGEFALHGVPAGTYKVTITPDEESGYNEIIENDVVVEEDGTADLETVFLDGSAE